MVTANLDLAAVKRGSIQENEEPVTFHSALAVDTSGREPADEELALAALTAKIEKIAQNIKVVPAPIPVIQQ